MSIFEFVFIILIVGLLAVTILATAGMLISWLVGSFRVKKEEKKNEELKRQLAAIENLPDCLEKSIRREWLSRQILLSNSRRLDIILHT